MTTLLLCPPTYYKISYEINPYMHVGTPSIPDKAKQQWADLEATLLKAGADLAYINPEPNCPDMVFTANAGLLKGKRVYLSHFKHPERQVEEIYFQTWFEKQGYTVELMAPDYFEGAGDSLFLGDTLFSGYGLRSSLQACQALEQHLKAPIVFCELCDPYFYHIDTCFCPINDHQAIWYPNAFTPATQKRMQAAAELIAVPEEEAKRFACNAVVIDKTIVLPTGCKQTEKQLQALGFQTMACDMSEYLKAGGACKCLTLAI